MLGTAIIITVLGTILVFIGWRMDCTASRVSRAHREEVDAMARVPASMLDVSQLMSRRQRCVQLEAEVDENLRRLGRSFKFVITGTIVFIIGIALLLLASSGGA